MADTYTQLYIHLVFAVKGRASLVRESLRERLEQYLCGIARTLRHKPLAIYCMPDHLHLLLGLHPDQSVADVVRELKSSSSAWVNTNQLLPHKFEWQRGYGAFSYAKSNVDNVVQYILNQPEHHRKTTFQTEFLALLTKFEIDYKPEYLFDWVGPEEC